MAKKSYFERFVEWQNYAHYALLAILMTLYYLGFATFDKTPMQMGLELFIVLVIADSIVHAIFWFAPKPIRWRD